MRLLFVVHGPVFGGGQGQMLRLAQPLKERGWDVLAVAPAGSEAAGRMRAGGLEVVEMPLHRLRATPDPRVQLPFVASLRGEIRALRGLIKEREIDAVQAHGDTNPHVALAAHREGRAVVWQLYDTRTPPPLRRVTMVLVTRVADVITTWGRALGEVHPGTSRLGERWVVVFPPVDGARFSPNPARRAAAREELGVAGGQLVVGAVGMLTPNKGFEHFVRAIAAVRRDHPDVVGRILGPSSEAHAAYEADVRREIEQLNADGQTVVDIRDAGPRVSELMPGFDALALTSVPRSEGMPTVILEAMACGLPVVATDVGAVSELIAEGETGYVVAPEDPGAIAARLRELAGDAALRKRMGEAGRRRFETEFALDKLADRTAAAYDLALEHRRTRR
jgi:glycosyltransferase involved in cell wall biosynthesis